MIRRALSATALCLSFMCFVPSVGSAHAFLDRSEPKVGAELNGAPTEVKIWFTQSIEPAFSKIRVFDRNGKEVDKMDWHVDKDDAKLLIVSLDHAEAGNYKVEWSVVSVDTHHTKGDFKFLVKG